MSEHPPLAVQVWGDFACFTRPELKVERVSYEVMTPSAARGILEAIFWKPEVVWRVTRIKVLRPIRHFSVLRNEVNKVIAPGSVTAWMKGGHRESYLADEDRAQRHTLALRDVAYQIEGQMILRAHADADIAKYRDQFRRRVTRGQCHLRPCLGCREFPAHFSEPDPEAVPLDHSDDLGQMLFDLRYDPEQGRHNPVFFPARLQRGVLAIPQGLYEEVGL